MSRYNTQVLSNIRMLCRMQNIDEKVLYERAKLILSIYREVCWSTIDRANDVCDTLICTYGDSLDAHRAGCRVGACDRQPQCRKIHPVLCRRVPFALEGRADCCLFR